MADINAENVLRRMAQKVAQHEMNNTILEERAESAETRLAELEQEVEALRALIDSQSDTAEPETDLPAGEEPVDPFEE